MYLGVDGFEMFSTFLHLRRNHWYRLAFEQHVEVDPVEGQFAHVIHAALVEQLHGAYACDREGAFNGFGVVVEVE